MTPKNIVPRDFFGQILEVGDYVMSSVIGKNPEIDLYQVESFDLTKWTNRNGKESVEVQIQRQGVKVKRPTHRCSVQLVKIDPSLITFRELI